MFYALELCGFPYISFIYKSVRRILQRGRRLVVQYSYRVRFRSPLSTTVTFIVSEDKDGTLLFCCFMATTKAVVRGFFKNKIKLDYKNKICLQYFTRLWCMFDYRQKNMCEEERHY